MCTAAGEAAAIARLKSIEEEEALAQLEELVLCVVNGTVRYRDDTVRPHPPHASPHQPLNNCTNHGYQ